MRFKSHNNSVLFPFLGRIDFSGFGVIIAKLILEVCIPDASMCSTFEIILSEWRNTQGAAKIEYRFYCPETVN